MGAQVVLNADLIPNGISVGVSGTINTAGSPIVLISDAKGNNYTFVGSGNPGYLYLQNGPVTPKTIVANMPLTIQFENQNAATMLPAKATIQTPTATGLNVIMVGSEDGTDNDFNDCVLLLYWPVG